MSSDQISFSLSLSSEVDILIYKVADVDRRRDRSIPRGNNGENYEGTRTHFPSLPTPESFSCYELSKRSRAEVGGGTRGNTRLGMRYAFYFATQTVRRSMTKNIGDPGKNSAEGQHPRETPRNFRRARIMEEDARVALVYYGHRARFSLRDDDATKLIRPRRTEGLLGRIERKLSLRVYPRRRYIQHTMHPRCNYVPIPRARFPRSCSLPARANRRENPRLLPRRLTPPLAQER